MSMDNPNIDVSGHRQIVHAAASLAASGSQVFAGFGYGDVYLILNIAGPFNGATIQFTVANVDPLDGTTVVGTVVVGSVLVAPGQQVLRLYVTESDTIKVSWVQVGAGPIVGVNATLIGKVAGTRNETIIVPAVPSGVLQDTAFGYVTLAGGGAAGLWQVVRETPYTEPAAAAQRSIASSNLNDTAAGTGARIVRITYFDTTLSTRFTEDVVLNGVTPVNTVAVNIRFIEKLEVISVGVNGTNQGVITLFGAAGGAGGVVGTIASPVTATSGDTVGFAGSGANRTNWVHHYVISGKRMFLIFLAAGLKGNAAGEFIIRAHNPLVATSPVINNIVPTLRVNSPANSITTQLAIPVPVVGPALVEMWARQDGGSGNLMETGFSFSEL